ncbi:nucleolar complex protein 4 homolog isoform X1 [Neltuma alba]|uniref:nucleolar complex protein 4 homolog isoform X1 n=1 Tax=Neltuma alba TaxID=207710 RepID=UPI0010A4AD68|nr:nucleolar complex protein 4 homolog isoform X1 [Prosopis alba]
MASKQKRKSNGLSDVKTLGLQLLSTRAHINNLPLLLSFISPTSPPNYVVESLLSLQSFFLPLLPDLPSSSSSPLDISSHDPQLIYRVWIRSKFDDFIKSLVHVFVSPQSDETLKEVVLDAMMEFVKVANGGKFSSSLYHKLLHGIVHSSDEVVFPVELLSSKYFGYMDVRYFTYISLGRFARTLEGKVISGFKLAKEDGINESPLNPSLEHVIRNIYCTISHASPIQSLDNPSNFEMWSESVGFLSKEREHEQLSKEGDLDDNQLKTEKRNSNVTSAGTIAKKMKSKFSKAWISYLRLPLPLAVYKEVLVNLHQAVIPHLTKPNMLCDFLTRSYDVGGVVSVMALSSLHVLMTQHGVEYPNFYEKLYALLVPSIFMAKHRAKFFQLLDSCLKSAFLPAYLAASFAKKLSRLLLSVSPSGALVIIALIHNLLRRHPSINCLVHREDGDEEGKDESKTNKVISDKIDDSKTGAMPCKKLGIDHFNNGETNPRDSWAMRSSLWETDSILQHYCPPVSRFALSLGTDLTVRAKTSEIKVEDFSSGSYATVFGEEIRRRVKQVPLAFYKSTPSSLFSATDSAGWTFKLEAEAAQEINERDISEHFYSPAKRQRKEGP